VNTTEAIAAVLAARTPADLFDGSDPPVRVYRRLARLTHPDVAPVGPLGAAAFARLAELWSQYASGITISTGRRVYRVGSLVRTGGVCHLYEIGADMLLKLPRRPGDNDLMQREAAALTAIARSADPRHLPYVPRLVESFRHRADGVERRANVISRVPAGFVTLAEIGPGSLDPRDAAWIWRRLLVAIGLAHQAGVVHGAVFGHHVLVHPIEHGLVLVDWCQSVPVGSPLTAALARHRDEYPPEVTARQPATEATDVYLATRCVAALMGDSPPRPIRAFIRGCTLAPQRQRPHDAWRLLAELDELLQRLYGPRKYRPLILKEAHHG
jgi:hypothetical protein